MNLQDIVWHLLNFLAPALALAVLMPTVCRIFVRKSHMLMGWRAQVLVNFIAGAAALLGALWWWGRDGKMPGYTILVLVVATSQWLLARGWRR